MIVSFSVRPELVEACPERLQGSRRGPFFLFDAARKEQGFDKLSPNGI
jgi:hypothetical protein